MDDENWQEKEKLHRAAQDGDLATIERLLADGFDINAFDFLGKTPLHQAAMGGHLEAVAFLIKHGADVNAHHEPSIGNTPLREVAANCSLEMAQLFVAAGADPSIPGWMQITALHEAEKRKRGDGPEVYALLLKAAARRRR